MRLTGTSQRVGYSLLLRAFLFIAAKFDKRLPDLRWREHAAMQRASRRRVAQRETATEQRQAATGRAAFWICLLAAVALAMRGTWWPALVVAGWWLVGLGYFTWKVAPMYRRGRGTQS
ncbi:MAG: hypothetical protein JWR63_1104 [Conexibacter sp.]|nr:hypothetical protein [Conexibacter sp.]